MKNIDLVPLFNMTSQGIGKWKKEKRPIISLIEKYHTKEELQEFLETGKIEKEDRFQELLEIEKKYNEVLQLINSQSQQNMQTSKNLERIQEKNFKIIIDVYDNYSEDVFKSLRLKNIIEDIDFQYDFQIDDVELTFNNIKTFNTAKKILKKYIQ